VSAEPPCISTSPLNSTPYRAYPPAPSKRAAPKKEPARATRRSRPAVEQNPRRFSPSDLARFNRRAAKNLTGDRECSLGLGSAETFLSVYPDCHVNGPVPHPAYGRCHRSLDRPLHSLQTCVSFAFPSPFEIASLAHAHAYAHAHPHVQRFIQATQTDLSACTPDNLDETIGSLHTHKDSQRAFIDPWPCFPPSTHIRSPGAHAHYLAHISHQTKGQEDCEHGDVH
jgi:hypothetical protein